MKTFFLLLFLATAVLAAHVCEKAETESECLAWNSCAWCVPGSVDGNDSQWMLHPADAFCQAFTEQCHGYAERTQACLYGWIVWLGLTIAVFIFSFLFLCGLCMTFLTILLPVGWLVLRVYRWKVRRSAKRKDEYEMVAPRAKANQWGGTK